MKFLKRLAQALVTGLVCGSAVLLLILGLVQLYNLDPSRNRFFLDLQSIVNDPFPRTMFAQSPFDYYLQPFALWFVVGLGARLVSRSNRAALFICIGLFVLNLLLGYFFDLLASGIGP
ncbi:MAG TPA: hypothetical protein VGB07_08355 [Blastocatellia bacterium]